MAKYTTKGTGKEIDSWDIYDYISPTVDRFYSIDHSAKDPLDWAEATKGNQWKYYDSDLKGSSRTRFKHDEIHPSMLASIEREAEDYWGETKNKEWDYDINEKPKHLLTNADRREIIGKDYYNKNWDEEKSPGTFVGGHLVPEGWEKSQVGQGTGDSYYAWTPDKVDFARWHEAFWNPDYKWTGHEYNYRSGKDGSDFIADWKKEDIGQYEYLKNEGVYKPKQNDFQVTADQLKFADAGLSYTLDSATGEINPYKWDIYYDDEAGWQDLERLEGPNTWASYSEDAIKGLFDTDTWRKLTAEQRSALQGTWQRDFQDVRDFERQGSKHWKGDDLTEQQRADWGLDIARTYDDEYWTADDFGLLQSEQESWNLFRDLNLGAVDYDYYNRDLALSEAAKRLDESFTGFSSVDQIRQAQLEEAIYGKGDKGEKGILPGFVNEDPGRPNPLTNQLTNQLTNPLTDIGHAVNPILDVAVNPPATEGQLYSHQSIAGATPEQLEQIDANIAAQKAEYEAMLNEFKATTAEEKADLMASFEQQMQDYKLQQIEENKQKEAQTQAEFTDWWGTEQANLIDKYEGLLAQATDDSQKALLTQQKDFEQTQLDKEAAWNNQLQELSKKEDVFQSQISSLKSELGVQEDLYGNLASDYSGLQSDFGGLQSSYGELQSDFGTAKADWALQAGDFKAEIGDLTGQIGGLETTLGQYTEWNKELEAAVKRNEELAIQNAERARVSASYGSQGRPMNKQVQGVRTLNELTPVKSYGGGTTGSFNRKGLRIKNLNI